RLVYLPVTSIPTSLPLREQLRDLVSSWMDHVEGLRLETWRELMEQFEENKFNLQQLQIWCDTQLNKQNIGQQIDSMQTAPNETLEVPIILKSNLESSSNENEDRDYLQELIPLEEAATSQIL